jgi:4-amino-4-deoxy-L-arabinose transferase-like glycosyltransferase
MRLKLRVPHTVDRWFNNLGRRPAPAVTGSILSLLLIGWVAFGWNLGSIGLIDETEPLFAEASRQMLITGDWITPYFNGETRFDKPILIYWCQAIAYAIIGVNEWAVRLPSALAAVGVISLGFYTVQWHLAQKDGLEKVSRPIRRYLTAFVATVIMAFNPEMIVWGRIGVSDMLLTGFIASALLCFFLGYANHPETEDSNQKIHNFPNKWYLACYVLIAGAILTKGPVGIVLPGLIILSFLLYLGKIRTVWREMRPLLGMVIILGLSVPWYALVIWRNGWNYINSFFGYHNLERFTEVVNGHSAPWYFYFFVVLLGFAPYSVYLPASLIRLKFWQRSHWRLQERSQQLSLFACFWFLVIFGFFSIAVTKLPSYVLPLMPAAAILVALFFSELSPDSKYTTATTDLQLSSWVNVAFLSALAVALFNLSQIIGYDPAAPDLYELIQKSGLATVGGITWLITAMLIAALVLSRRWHLMIIVNSLGFAAFLILTLTPALFLMDQQRQLPLRELSAVIVTEKQPNEELLMVGFKKPSVVFYTHSRVNYLKFSELATEHIQKITTQPVKPPSLLVLAEEKMFLKMDLQPDHYKSLATKGAYHLIRISMKRTKAQKLDIS